MTTEVAASRSLSTLSTAIVMPYTLTAGRATGTFLAELAQKQILGSKCDTCSTVRVPAQDYCGDCGSETPELLRVPDQGELVAWTLTDQGVIGLILLDGTDIPLVHQILDAEPDSLEIGARVTARWAEERTGHILDLAGFVLAPDAPRGELSPVGELSEPIAQQAYNMRLEYEHSYGYFYGTLFDGIADRRHIRGVQCPSCQRVLVPPRALCERCFEFTKQWIDLPDTGVVQGCSVVHIEFIGQRVPPPYVYAEIILDGASTRLIHTVGGISAEDARAGGVHPGSRVRAVWSDRHTGNLTDIDYFEVVPE